MPNNTQISCDIDRIEAFLQQQLSTEEQSDFEAHLDDCQDCRNLLEASAASEELWAGVRESLSSQPLSLDQNDSAANDQTEFSHQTVLDWLAPTDDDRMLGRLGNYEILGIVGSGGMGVVLKAFDPALNRNVAIKVLAPHLGSSGAARRRFSREAQASAAVVHDNVIEIHGVSEKDGLSYLVMPYVSGPSLQRRLDHEGPFELAEILRIGMQAARGLAAAHSQGLVHRDVKPANILLEQGIERVKLTDFGLARAADDASLTKSGVIAGTPQYMSPEQARGETIDQRSDLFSLGSVLYAMCTGRAPFRAETSYGVLRRITDDEPRPIREINPEIPEWLCEMISRLMSKDPDHRFQSAQEVAELLEQCLAHVQQPTVVPLPESLAPRTTGSRFFSLSRLTWTAFGVLGFGVVALLLWQATPAPDVSGDWQGEQWGDVTLKQVKPGKYVGTYTDVFQSSQKSPHPERWGNNCLICHKDSEESLGTIELKWSRLDQRYRGTWAQGKQRFGRISVEVVDGEIRGFWDVNKKSGINPGMPEREAPLLWVRRTGENTTEHRKDKFETLVEEFKWLIERRRYEDASALALKEKVVASDEDARQLWELRSRFAKQLVKAKSNSDEEQKLLELMDFPLQRIADSRNAHTSSSPQPYEVIAAVEKNEKLPENSLNDLFKQNRGNIRIVVEPVYDKVEEPRFYPLVGMARLHRVRFKGTLYFTESDDLKWPGADKGKGKITKTVLIDHDHLIRAEQKAPTEDSSSKTFTPFDCLIVDSETGEPIPGKDFAIGLVFEIPKTEDRPWQLVQQVLLGRGHPGTFQFEIPEKVMQHPDRDLIQVRWFVMHPQWEQFGEYDPPRVNELINNDPRTARDGLKRIALRPTNANSVQPESFNEFTVRVHILQNLGVQKVGRDPLRQLYQSLLEQYPEHPDRAAAMYEIAALWSNAPEDRAQFIIWLRKAVKASREGTPLWYKSRFWLQARLQRTDPDEAEQILTGILDSQPGPVNEVKVWNQRVTLALSQDDEERAEQICRQLHERMKDGQHLPEDTFERGNYYQEIQSSAHSLLNYWFHQSDVAGSIRRAKIEAFWRDYPFRHVDRYIEQLSKMPGQGIELQRINPDGTILNRPIFNLKWPAPNQPKMTLSFQNAPYQEVVQLLAEKLELPVRFDIQPKGTFSYKSDKPIPAAGVLEILNRDLEDQGLEILREDGRLRVCKVELAVLTPQQLVSRGAELYTSMKKVKVRLKVGSVQIHQVTDLKGNTQERWELVADHEAGFSIRISPAAEEALTKRGVEDIPDFFAGKVIEVEGRIYGVGLNLISRPNTIWTYHIDLDSLDQYRVVSDDMEFNQLPAEQPATTTEGPRFSKTKELILAINNSKCYLDLDTGKTVQAPAWPFAESEMKEDVFPSWDSGKEPPTTGLTGIRKSGDQISFGIESSETQLGQVAACALESGASKT